MARKSCANGREGFGIWQRHHQPRPKRGRLFGCLWPRANWCRCNSPCQIEDVSRRNERQHTHKNRLCQNDRRNAGRDEQQNAGCSGHHADQVRPAPPKTIGCTHRRQTDGGGSGASHQNQRGQPQKNEIFEHVRNVIDGVGRWPLRLQPPSRTSPRDAARALQKPAPRRCPQRQPTIQTRSKLCGQNQDLQD